MQQPILNTHLHPVKSLTLRFHQAADAPLRRRPSSQLHMKALFFDVSRRSESDNNIRLEHGYLPSIPSLAV